MGFVFVPNIIFFLLALNKNLGTTYDRNISRIYILKNGLYEYQSFVKEKRKYFM